MTRTRLSTLLAVARARAGVAGVLPAAESKPRVDKPNIIFILADDLGIDGVGCYGGDKYKTDPNIDALAKTGVRFEACYAAPLCGPSRCLLMTGRYAFRTGGLTNGSWRDGGVGAKSKDEVGIARLLKQNGYAPASPASGGRSAKRRRIGASMNTALTPRRGGWYWKKSYIKNGKTIEKAKEVYCPDVDPGRSRSTSSTDTRTSRSFSTTPCTWSTCRWNGRRTARPVRPTKSPCTPKTSLTWTSRSG